MRVVADTNVIVSAFLWDGVPGKILIAADEGQVQLFTSRALVAELEDVLSRGKFAMQLNQTRFTAAYLLARYTQLATMIVPSELVVPVLRDPDDTQVLACAVATRVDAIVSGDSDLLSLGTYAGVPIITAATCLQRLRM